MTPNPSFHRTGKAAEYNCMTCVLYNMTKMEIGYA
jgi:hypothetical protein